MVLPFLGGCQPCSSAPLIENEPQRPSHGIPLTGQRISLERGSSAHRGCDVDAAARARADANRGSSLRRIASSAARLKLAHLDPQVARILQRMPSAVLQLRRVLGQVSLDRRGRGVNTSRAAWNNRRRPHPARVSRVRLPSFPAVERVSSVERAGMGCGAPPPPPIASAMPTSLPLWT